MLLRLANPTVMTDGRARPVSALAQVPGELIGMPVLNSRLFGGYLTLAGLHPFIDGRIELFGDDFVTNYVAMSGPSVLAQQVARYMGSVGDHGGGRSACRKPRDADGVAAAILRMMLPWFSCATGSA